MRSLSLGKLLISLVALFSAFGSYIFDWNKTHLLNPNWPPHAKFHNAQDMLMGTTTGLLALWVLWLQKVDNRNKLGLSVTLASLYWITQFGAIFFPGTALSDAGPFGDSGLLPLLELSPTRQNALSRACT